MKHRYPQAVDTGKVGTYPALTTSGGGYFYDEVLEYRVWVYPEEGDYYFRAFTRYDDAKAFSTITTGAEKPLVLVLQREWINEPEPNDFEVKRGERLTEWKVGWLKGSKRQPDRINEFLKMKQKR